MKKICGYIRMIYRFLRDIPGEIKRLAIYWWELCAATILFWDLKYKKVVTFYGSARVHPLEDYTEEELYCKTKVEYVKILEDTLLYRQVEYLGFLLGCLGYVGVTGGGGALMEAFNKGIKKARMESIGFALRGLPCEQTHNVHCTRSFRFFHFNIRKLFLTRYSNYIIAGKGGSGTLDEISDNHVLKQTKKADLPFIILWPGRFFQGLINWLRDNSVKQGLMSEKDLDIYVLVDEIDEIIRMIKKNE